MVEFFVKLEKNEKRNLPVINHMITFRWNGWRKIEEKKLFFFGVKENKTARIMAKP